MHARITQRDYRLVTLVGEGGIGKSRLALEVAWRLREQFADGVWFVPLVGLEAKPAGGSLNELTARQNLPQVDSLPDAIATAVAQTLDYLLTGQQPPRDQLLAFLRERQLLLVLDNFEQLLAGAQLVLDLLHQAPGVCVICTSREPLNFQAEWVLLTPVEQVQLASLSVFLGPFSMRSAEIVTKATLHELQTLQEKSLLQRQGERFAFHSLLRQFAAEKLANFPENEAAVRHSH